MYRFLEIHMIPKADKTDLSIETGRFLKSPIKISVFLSLTLAKDDQIRPISNTFGNEKSSQSITK